MKKVFIILCVIFFSCQNEFSDYNKVDDGIYMKLVSFEGDDKPYEEDSFVSAFIEIVENDKSKYKRYPFRTFLPKENKFDKIFNYLNEGDSAIFMIDSKFFKENSLNVKLPEFQSQYLKVFVKVYHYFNKKEHSEYNMGKSDEVIEQLILKRYLKENNTNHLRADNGIYKIVEENGVGEARVEKGKTIQFRYLGKFINNIVFDETTPDNYIEFEYGTPDQVIKGIEIALKGMKKGEKSKIIIPSHLAFGSEGSSSGIVPPYTTVIYKVEILNIQ